MFKSRINWYQRKTPAYWLVDVPNRPLWLIKCKFTPTSPIKTVGTYNTKELAQEALAIYRSGKQRANYNYKSERVVGYDDRPLDDDLVD